MADPWAVLAAAAIEGVLGYPRRVHAWLPHPVSWLGAGFALADRWLNRDAFAQGSRRVLGALTLVIVAGSAAGAGRLLERTLAEGPWSLLVVAAAGSFGLAARNLYDHVAAVARALAKGDVPAARAAVGRIVGRDVEALDESHIAAAALESLAESFNDGVIAPLFWFVVAGLPGLFAYKAVNTADSMIGHMDPRWRAFGWASAKSDDLAGLIPARCAGALIVLAAGRGWRVMWRDAGKHASPNAGWPEAAMAGALGVRLGGSVRYDGVEHARPVLGGGRAPAATDLTGGLVVYGRACATAALALFLGGLAWRC